MVLVQILSAACALAAADDAVLLEFTSANCPACVQNAPAVERLQREGYPVRQLDYGENRQLAARYGVHYVPTFVLLANQREVERVDGPASYARLLRLLERAQVRPAESREMLVRGQSPDKRAPIRPVSYSTAAQTGVDAEALALAATVKLTVEDPQGRSHGTGTIIDVHGDEALVLTCGHIFRDSQGRGAITAELIVDGVSRTAPGQLIAFDADDRDIGLVSIRPPVRVVPARVASPDVRLAPSQGVFSIGCDHGAPPTVRRSRITAIDKYLGAPNVEVAGQPVDGRSGGGLFTADGRLIGVCNAADPQDNEGVYAALATIHWQLDEIGQQRIYQRSSSALAAGGAGLPDRNSPRLADYDPPDMPDHLPRATVPAVSRPFGRERESGSRAAFPAGASDATEVICIVRSRDDPEQSEVIVLDSPSAELLSRIASESRHPGGDRASTALLDRRGGGSPGFEVPTRSEVIRGQSYDR